MSIAATYPTVFLPAPGDDAQTEFSVAVRTAFDELLHATPFLSAFYFTSLFFFVVGCLQVFKGYMPVSKQYLPFKFATVATVHHHGRGRALLRVRNVYVVSNTVSLPAMPNVG